MGSEVSYRINKKPSRGGYSPAEKERERMKKRFRVEGYAYNLRQNVSRLYWEDEIKLFEGKMAELNGACLCVANRRQDNPRFRAGEFTITEVTE